MFKLKTVAAGAAAVAGGAFGAHAIKGTVTPDRMQTYSTAMNYLLLHSVAVVAIWSAARALDRKEFNVGGWLIVAGMLIFAGSLFFLVVLDLPALGAVTPIGGVLMIAGWLSVAVGAVSADRKSGSD